MAPTDRHRASPLALLGGVFLLFTIWAWSFIAIESLLVSESGPPRFCWLGLAAARFGLAALVCGGYLALFRAGEALEVIRLRWRRLLLCGLFCVPGYNFALYAGQQQRVPAPIASLLTTLAPLFLMLLSAAFLHERITRRRAGGFLVAVAGLVLIASARDDGRTVAYPLLIGLTALAPLSWAIHSALTKPVMETVSPLLWTYLVVVFGGAPLLLVLPLAGGGSMVGLDLSGWGILLYLVALCTVVGFAVWSWLLRHLPATSVGFTVFLNPPLTTVYKLLQAAVVPGAVAYTLLAGEAFGGLTILLGVAVAVWRPPEARPGRTPPGDSPGGPPEKRT
jgi:O-acetylserine/cysteine efflux transporter